MGQHTLDRPIFKQYIIFEIVLPLFFTIIFGVIPYVLQAAGINVKRDFDINDTSLMYEYKENLISSWVPVLLIVIGAVLNLIIVKWNRFHIVFAAILQSYGATLSIQQLTKALVGRLRPDFFDRCNPLQGARAVANHVCQNTDLKFINEGRMSFPSGHTTHGFYAAVLFTLAGLRLTSSPGARLTCVVVPLLAVGVVTGASRITDNRHHATDVLAGLVVGLVGGAATGYLEKMLESRYEKMVIQVETVGNESDANL